MRWPRDFFGVFLLSLFRDPLRFLGGRRTWKAFGEEAPSVLKLPK